MKGIKSVMDKTGPINTLFDKLLIVGFSAIISIPFIFADKMGGGISNSENRRLAMMPFVNENHELIPDLEFSELQERTEQWIDDNAYGRDYFYEELLGLRFRISVFSFFQTNSPGAEVLYSTAREFIGNLSGREESGEKPDKVVFDLYSGTGTIAQLMAPMAKKVVGVEIVEEAVKAARENAALNGLNNCEFIAGDVLKVLDELEEKPDFIILDITTIYRFILILLTRFGVLSTVARWGAKGRLGENR